MLFNPTSMPEKEKSVDRIFIQTGVRPRIGKRLKQIGDTWD
jgi:hypothetical protein